VMNSASNYDDYLSRKTSGEKIIPIASMYGLWASSFTSDDFLVITLNMDTFSFYKYHVEGGKFFVADFRESIPHQISKYIPHHFIQDSAMMQWWKNVFFEQDGQCTYDSYYDTLSISEDSNIVFKDLINDVEALVHSLHIPSTETQLFLTGDLSGCFLVRYVFQQCFPSSKVRMLQASSTDDLINEKDIVLRPEEQLKNYVLHANGDIKFSMLTTSPVSITLPLLSMNSMMISGVNWGEMLHDQQEDYSVGNFGFKKVNIHVECDVFQNIFIVCEDLKGNRKVKHIN